MSRTFQGKWKNLAKLDGDVANTGTGKLLKKSTGIIGTKNTGRIKLRYRK